MAGHPLSCHQSEDIEADGEVASLGCGNTRYFTAAGGNGGKQECAASPRIFYHGTKGMCSFSQEAFTNKIASGYEATK
jgi:hypothetical protein